MFTKLLVTLCYSYTAAWRVYKCFRTEASLLKHKNLAQECRGSIYSYIARYESRLIDSGNILAVSIVMQIINLVLKLLLALYYQLMVLLLSNQRSKPNYCNKYSHRVMYSIMALCPLQREMYHLLALTTFYSALIWSCVQSKN